MVIFPGLSDTTSSTKMGNKVPVPDERMQKTIDLLRMEKKQLGVLWSKFRKHDADRSGEIDIDEFYAMIGEKRSVFGDSIFELIDIDQGGTLDFSEFVQTLGTYCMFGRHDIRKFCFYIFDKDKNGYIEQDELTALIDMLHENNLGGNCKVAMDKFDTNNDGKIDFQEFTVMDMQYPMLLFPAYRMQENMMEHTLGKKWWIEKRMMLQSERDAEEKEKDKLSEKERLRKEALRQREIRRKMGYIQYYLFFWKRSKYEVKKVEVEEKNDDKANTQKKNGAEIAGKGKKKKKKDEKLDEKELKKLMKKKNRDQPLTTAEERAERKKKRKREKNKDKTRM